MSDWKTDLSWSAQAFLDLVWPILRTVIRGELMPVETGARSDMAKALDMYAGIDAWHLCGSSMRGIASRIQDIPLPFRPYNTFTVRRTRNNGQRTEYEKRLAAIHSANGWLYPHLTVQAYVTAKIGGELLSFGMVQTRTLIEYIEHNEPRIRIKPTSNADFYIVPFSDIAIYTYNAQDNQRQAQEQIVLPF